MESELGMVFYPKCTQPNSAGGTSGKNNFVAVGAEEDNVAGKEKAIDEALDDHVGILAVCRGSPNVNTDAMILKDRCELAECNEELQKEKVFAVADFTEPFW